MSVRCLLAPGVVAFALIALGTQAPGAEAPQIGALENVHLPAEGVLSGGEPHGGADFAALADAGVRTVVSVDGAPPDAAAARRYGLRYVHIPIGYDGVDPEARLALARVARECRGRLYVHCHHGKHRGPAAAAVVCLTRGSIDADQALAYLKRAGTSPDYAGLWRDVAAYTSPPAGAELPELVEVARVDSLVAAMAQADRASDYLTLLEKTAWRSPADHPDLDPLSQAVILREAMAESLRHVLNDPHAHPGLVDRLNRSVGLTEALEQALVAGADPTPPWRRVRAACDACHAEHRNGP